MMLRRFALRASVVYRVFCITLVSLFILLSVAVAIGAAIAPEGITRLIAKTPDHREEPGTPPSCMAKVIINASVGKLLTARAIGGYYDKNCGAAEAATALLRAGVDTKDLTRNN